MVQPPLDIVFVFISGLFDNSFRLKKCEPPPQRLTSAICPRPRRLYFTTATCSPILKTHITNSLRWVSLIEPLSLSLRCQPMCDIECHSSPHLIWDYGPPLLCSLTRLTTAIGREFFHSLSSDLKNMEHFLTWKNVAATLVLCNSPFGPDSSLARASSDSLSSVFFFSPQCATCTRHLQCDANSAQLCP